MDRLRLRVHRMSPMKAILIGYCMIILVGAILLWLPISAKEQFTSFSDALFTAASATCVTGLIRFDTYTHWTWFGQMVILILIQIGGVGFMTFTISMMMLTRKKIGLNSRLLMQNSISAPQVGGIIRMTKFIIMGSFSVETIGAMLLAFYFCPRYGFLEGLWFAGFHSISAFCNAGFDLMGKEKPFSSLTLMSANWYVCGIIMALIIVGGLGFFVWKDFIQSKGVFSKLRLQSKLVLSVSGMLLVGGAIALILTERRASVFLEKGIGEQTLDALFQSVTARTAGFNSIDFGTMTEAGLFVMIMLMFIGGSTGSTAGGIKTTTAAVLMVSVAAMFRQKKSLEIFKRRLEDSMVRTAACVFMLYLFLSLSASVILSAVERVPIITTLFECVSAIATVGLSLGITPELGFLSKIILILLMIFGRVGSITMLLAFATERGVVDTRLPLEKIQIG